MRTGDGLLIVGAAEGLHGPDDIVVKLQASETGGRWPGPAPQVPLAVRRPLREDVSPSSRRPRLRPRRRSA